MQIAHPSDYRCKYCESKVSMDTILVPELMYETGEKFVYVVCGECKSIQIDSIPADLQGYYRGSYAPHRHKEGIKKWLDRVHARHIYERKTLMGYLLDLLRNRDTILQEFSIRKYPKSSRILDIGCGSGDLLKKLHILGYENLKGIDPYLAEPFIEQESVVLEKKNIEEATGEYDVIILNHVLEHTPDPNYVMEHLSRLLAPKGHILLSCPLADSGAWHRYREHWIQLDPPRHLSIPSERAVISSASKYGLNTLEVKFNSTEFQILGSEDAQKGIGLLSKKSVYSGGIANRIKIILSKVRYYQTIKQWNTAHKGDQALFVISK